MHMDVQVGTKTRTRQGCWTCRNRKKKCDQSGPPCGSCFRLGLKCENEVKLVWEDDQRRDGMRRRGPPAKRTHANVAQKDFSAPSSSKPYPASASKSTTSHDSKFLAASDSGARPPEDCSEELSPISSNELQALATRTHIAIRGIPGFPHRLTPTESLLLENYVQRFSRIYPTHSGPNNPFLTVFLPLAWQSDVVLNSLLALSGAQGWGNASSEIKGTTLSLRQQALGGCRALLQHGTIDMLRTTHQSPELELQTTRPNGQIALSRRLDSLSEEQLVALLTSSILFLLYEKLSGEINWKPHLEFIHHLFNQSMHRFEGSEAFQFIHHLFLYNDLVRSTSLQKPVLSAYYLRLQDRDTESFGSQPWFHFPNLIARISTGDKSVSSEDFDVWNGNMDWLPSFALRSTGNHSAPDSDMSAAIDFSSDSSEQHGSCDPLSERGLLIELYRTAAKVFRLQVIRTSDALSSASVADVSFETTSSNDSQQIIELSSWAIQLIQMLPDDSSFETALLWPIGIAAKELPQEQMEQRMYIIRRLRTMQQRLLMKNFQRVQEVLIQHWSNVDSGISEPQISPDDEILFG